MQKVYAIDEDGISGLWDDDICVGLGDAKIRRASDVEPTEDGKWIVKILEGAVAEPPGIRPRDRYLCQDGDLILTTDKRYEALKFDRRDDAIAAEVDYLNDIIKAGRMEK